jgi:hypothetical protein
LLEDSKRLEVISSLGNDLKGFRNACSGALRDLKVMIVLKEDENTRQVGGSFKSALKKHHKTSKVDCKHESWLGLKAKNKIERNASS